MKKSKIYTKTGDQGETGLVSGTRTSKSDLRIDVYGEVDELNSRIGWLISLSVERERALLEEVQSALFDLGANLACEDSKRAEWKLPAVGAGLVAKLEAAIDAMDDELTPLKQFILPGGTPAAAAAHLARTQCRLVERRMVLFHQETLELLPEQGLAFINRLSDYFFVLARWLNKQAGVAETSWQPRR